ncbi:mitochondrial ATP-independent inner membrane protease subunit 2 isoform X2 [Cryptomeria japonica]|uniref:mitochondrial ATP-independent inner membrane protease subunit 2 isoform X2 n=1 Tax=Cryptomeria japonica TaxID=3369 RepID=UPI0027D9FEC0|nr:mitochondrial ATP-independent inner membrane protease subunit 2 isoform X2 [Cryptomeria japonica]
MGSFATWFRYIIHKVQYSVSLSWKNYKIGEITDKQVNENVFKNVFQGKLTYLHYSKGEEMAPTVSSHGGTLLVRRLPTVDPKTVFVGDVVALKDPQNPDNSIVRRLAAVEGEEMLSTDEKEEPFFLEKDQCWVISDNESLSPKDACDSRIFGPVPMSNILGRVIYCLRSSVDHGPIINSLSLSDHTKESPFFAVMLLCRKTLQSWLWSLMLMRWQGTPGHEVYSLISIRLIC